MSPSSLEKKKRIVIVGAGAFGLSTALHLQRHHKHDIDVLLVDSQPFPSVDSASGNDTSRQIRMDYPDSFYANLARQAIQAWKTDPVFSSHWRQSGRVGAAAPGSPYLERCRNTLREAGVEIQEFNGDGGKDNKTKELQKVFPMLGNPDLLKGWDFYFTPEAGWANPREAVISAMREYQSLGGSFIGDPTRGYVVDNILGTTEDEDETRVIGVRTADAQAHRADHVIYATGALTTSIAHLLPGLDTQIHPTGLAIAHWKLTPGELEAWINHPTVDIYHHGYFFPPDPATGVMKLGLGITGFTYDGEASAATSTNSTPKEVGIARPNSSLISTPHEGRIPALAERKIRSVLRVWAPSLAEKRFFDMKMCWDAMVPDGGWLIDHHPQIRGLSVATGGSGHGFKFLPVVGGFVCDVLGLGSGEGVSVSKRSRINEMKEKWRWGRAANMGVMDRRAVLQGRSVLNLLDCFREEEEAVSSKL